MQMLPVSYRAPNGLTAMYADTWSHPLLVPGDTMEMAYRRLSDVILSFWAENAAALLPG